MTDTLMALGASGLIVAGVWFCAHRLGRYVARAHDRKYFPPAVLRRGKDGLK